LLGHYGIKAALSPYHDHNAHAARPRLLAALADGKAVALVSDAGTPLVSDPGFKLVAEAAAAGHKVVPVPGASAPLAALAASGLPTDAFYFGGFLPPRSAARRRTLEPLRPLKATLIFFEGQSRVAALLADMAAVLGPRQAVVARELTKYYEELRRGALGDLAAHYEAAGAPKGEVVVLAGPPGTVAQEEAGTDADLDALLGDALAEVRLKTAVERVTALTGLPRKTVYARALELKDASAAARGKGDEDDAS
jgi:16S rRNA (cytidine1402-2'-O)-methyltransferase